MGKYKEQPKYNVVSFRVSDAEKALLDEMIEHRQINIARLMWEAITTYSSSINVNSTRGSISQG